MKVYHCGPAYDALTTCTCMACRANYAGNPAEVRIEIGEQPDIRDYKLPCPACGERERIMIVVAPKDPEARRGFPATVDAETLERWRQGR